MADRIRAGRALEHQDAEAARLADEVRRFLQARGDERALDAGTGTGALAFALAPLVGEVVGVDNDPERLRLARERAAGVPNVSFVEGDTVRSRSRPRASTSPRRCERSTTFRARSSSSRS